MGLQSQAVGRPENAIVGPTGVASGFFPKPGGEFCSGEGV